MYYVNRNATQKRSNEIAKQYQTNIIRVNLNSLSMRNYPFADRAFIYPEKDVLNSTTSFIAYDYMHIRMKP